MAENVLKSTKPAILSSLGTLQKVKLHERKSKPRAQKLTGKKESDTTTDEVPDKQPGDDETQKLPSSYRPESIKCVKTIEELVDEAMAFTECVSFQEKAFNVTTEEEKMADSNVMTKNVSRYDSSNHAILPSLQVTTTPVFDEDLSVTKINAKETEFNDCHALRTSLQKTAVKIEPAEKLVSSTIEPDVFKKSSNMQLRAKAIAESTGDSKRALSHPKSATSSTKERKRIHHFCTLPETVEQLPKHLQYLLRHVDSFSGAVKSPFLYSGRLNRVGLPISTLNLNTNELSGPTAATTMYCVPAPPKLCLPPPYVEETLFPAILPVESVKHIVPPELRVSGTADSSKVEFQETLLPATSLDRYTEAPDYAKLAKTEEQARHLEPPPPEKLSAYKLTQSDIYLRRRLTFAKQLSLEYVEDEVMEQAAFLHSEIDELEKSETVKDSASKPTSHVQPGTLQVPSTRAKTPKHLRHKERQQSSILKEEEVTVPSKVDNISAVQQKVDQSLTDLIRERDRTVTVLEEKEEKLQLEKELRTLADLDSQQLVTIYERKSGTINRDRLSDTRIGNSSLTKKHEVLETNEPRAHRHAKRKLTTSWLKLLPEQRLSKSMTIAIKPFTEVPEFDFKKDKLLKSILNLSGSKSSSSDTEGHESGVLSRSVSYDCIDLRKISRIFIRSKQQSIRYTRSFPSSLNWGDCKEEQGMLDDSLDDREVARNIWNNWFDEQFLVKEKVVDIKDIRESSSEDETCMFKTESTRAKSSEASMHVLLNLRNEVSDELDSLNEVIESGEGLVAAYLCRRGAIYFRLKLYTMALKDIERAISLEPKLIDAYWYKYKILLQRGKTAAAMRDLDHIISAAGTNPQVVADAYKAKAEIYESESNTEMALVCYTEAIKATPKDNDLLLRRAALHEKNKSYDLANLDYEKALQFDATNISLKMKQATLYIKAEKWHWANIALSSILNNHPTNTEARMLRAKVYVARELWKYALEDYSIVIHIEPNHSQAFYQRGCLLRHVKYNKALQDLSVSLLLDSSIKNYMAFFHRALMYYSKQSYDDAIFDMLKVVELKPDLVAVLISVGCIYLVGKDNPLCSVKYFSMAIKRDPTMVRPRLCRVHAYRKLRLHKKALKEMSFIIHLWPNVIDFYVIKGDIALEIGDSKVATTCLFQGAEFATDLKHLPVLQAEVLCFAEKYEKAIEIIETALKESHLARYWLLLGKIQWKAGLNEHAVTSLQQSLKNKTKEELTGFMEFQPQQLKLKRCERIDALYTLGLAYQDMCDYKKALYQFNQVLKLDNNMAMAHFHKGHVLLRMGEAKGMFSISTALQLNHKVFQAFLTRAAFYSLQDLDCKAILNCNEALRIYPDSIRSYIYRGAMKYRIGVYDMAERDLTVAVQLDRQCALAHFNRAICWQKLTMYEEALNDYSLVLMLNTSEELNLYSHLNRCLIYLAINEEDAALHDILEALRLEPDDTVILHTAGICHHRLNQLPDAVVKFSHAAHLNVHFLEAYLCRANALMDYRQDDATVYAGYDYQRVLRLNPTFLPARVALAYNLQTRGKFQKAWNHLTIAIHLKPNYVPALEARAVVCLQMGNKYAALQDMLKAISFMDRPELLLIVVLFTSLWVM